MGAALLVCRLVLAAVFAIAALAKLTDLGAARRAVAEFGVPERLAPAAGALLPAAELAVAVAVIPTPAARGGAAAAAALLAGFMGAISYANRHGRTPDCHCFGQLHSAPAGPTTLARNGALLALAGFVTIAGAGDRVTPALVAATAAVTALAAAVIARRGPEPRVGLKVGARAPDFELEGTGGALHSLRSLLSGATHLVLVFTDSECTTCHALIPELAGVQRRAQDIRVAIVASGDRERNRATAAELVLLQREREIAEAYHIQGTPMATVIDANGRIERPPLAGPDAISGALAELVPHRDEPAELGDPIPDLVLPDPEGRRVALRELYRDPTVVLFWDAACEFSRQMLPGLRAFEREATPGAPRLIVISAGDVPIHTFTSPVLLDPDGRARAAFAATGTPMAVLLSENQVASPVAPGARTVFNLLDAATLAPH